MLAQAKGAECIAEDPRSGDSVTLLDGGARAFPRMLDAIRNANSSVHLEVYSFALDAIGRAFIAALVGAAGRGLPVSVVIDGWGSLRSGRSVAAKLKEAGCEVILFNPLRSLLAGRLRRNHRKLLLVDCKVAFVGGINIADEYADGERTGWADLALEVRGPAARRLHDSLRRTKQPHGPATSVRIFLSGLGGGRKLLKRYLRAFRAASNQLLLAHSYFLPNRRVVRSLLAAAKRGVRVTLLLAGRTDVPLARAATRRLYQKFLQAGVELYEWNDSVLHAKAAAVDEQIFLVGSFNLDPLSLANLEALVEIHDPGTVQAGKQWIQAKIARSARVDPSLFARPRLKRWITDVIGLWAARLAEWIGRVVARSGRPGPP
jgi:cardiolipin synthase